MGRKGKNIRKIIIVISIITIVISSLVLINAWDKKNGTFTSDYTDTTVKTDVEYEGKTYVLNNSIETVLVIGLDKFDNNETDFESYTNDSQADFLMLFILDNDKKTCTALHINRDTMADVDILGVAGQKIETKKMQIALSHTYGNGQQVSLRNTADSVSSLLGGITIDHTVSTTMDSVAILNDLVGGVEVTVLDHFKGIEESFIKGEKTLLLGDKALTYVRARKGVSDNERRMARQKQYLEALYENVLKAVENDEDFAVKAVTKLSDYIISNSHTQELQDLSQKITQYTFDEIRLIEGETVNGEEYIEFYPDEEKLKSEVISLFYKLK